MFMKNTNGLPQAKVALFKWILKLMSMLFQIFIDLMSILYADGIFSFSH
jgi:hypothetical protein